MGQMKGVYRLGLGWEQLPPMPPPEATLRPLPSHCRNPSRARSQPSDRDKSFWVQDAVRSSNPGGTFFNSRSLAARPHLPNHAARPRRHQPKIVMLLLAFLKPCPQGSRAHAPRLSVNADIHLVGPGRVEDGHGSLGHAATLRIPSRSSNSKCGPPTGFTVRHEQVCGKRSRTANRLPIARNYKGISIT